MAEKTERYTSEKLRRASQAVYLATEESVADELSAMLKQAANDAEMLAKMEDARDKLLSQLQGALELAGEREREVTMLRLALTKREQDIHQLQQALSDTGE